MTNPFTPTVPTQQPATAPAAGNPFSSPAPTAPQPAPAQQYAPQQAAAPAPVGFDMNRVNAAPAPVVGEGGGANLKAMYGRLVVLFPLAIDNVPRNPQYITQEQRNKGQLTQDRLTATVVVLDDGQGGQQPIQFGGDPYALPPKPHTESAPLPYVRKGMWINQSRLISQARPFLPGPDGRPGVIVGRVLKTGPEQNAPWYLSTATEAEVTLARQYLEAVQAGHVPHPLA